MKKNQLREQAHLADVRARLLATEVAQLKAEVAAMHKHWRPVPIAHPWQPKNAQCSLCDEPRDAPRHQEVADASPRAERLAHGSTGWLIAEMRTVAHMTPNEGLNTLRLLLKIYDDRRAQGGDAA